MYRTLFAAMRTLFTIVLLLIAFATAALAQRISGTFAYTGSSDCLEVVPPATFDSNFKATDIPVFHTNAYMMGYRVFSADGTGAAYVIEGVSTFAPVPPDTATAGFSSASAWTVSSQFTYTVDQNKVITMTLTPGSYLQTFTQGGRTGQTLTQDVFDLYGYLTPDGEELFVVSKGAEMETRTFSNGDVRRDACTRQYVGHRIAP